MAVMDSMIWVIEDKGNKPIMTGLDFNGKILRRIHINQQNIDWEDLTVDDEKNIYIGDFGNNDNNRQDLAIYKILYNNLQQDSINTVQTTTFYYPEQQKFPPKKKDFFYDCEAFIEWGGNFYLFTKNRSAGFDGTVFVYKLPNAPGHFAAEKIGEFITCAKYNNCVITAAALSPDKKQVALLSHDRYWIIENFEANSFQHIQRSMYQLYHHSQKEAIDFEGPETLWIMEERTDKHTGAHLYRIDRRHSDRKP